MLCQHVSPTHQSGTELLPAAVTDMGIRMTISASSLPVLGVTFDTVRYERLDALCLIENRNRRTAQRSKPEMDRFLVR